jgi:hypothetical protein
MKRSKLCFAYGKAAIVANPTSNKAGENSMNLFVPTPFFTSPFETLNKEGFFP